MYEEGGAGDDGESRPGGAFTRLERDLVDAIERSDSPYAAGFAAQVALARVTERENTGVGFITTIDIDRRNCAPLSAYRAVEGELTDWIVFHVEIAGLKRGLHASIGLRDGYFRQIEGMAYGDDGLGTLSLDGLVASSIEIV
ncbi:hypothetical protein sos41_19040 [Alphaproteobacteria bacterium SO-S41]|nr:hypothetical protein sos41_19040 [Alphaproteobacteria bacterium SO-S41]